MNAIDPTGWIPDHIKQQFFDHQMSVLAEYAEKAGRTNASERLKRLRLDASFQEAVDQGLSEATARFVRDYRGEYEELAQAIESQDAFWKAENVRQSILNIIMRPGVDLPEDRKILTRSFAGLLHRRVNRERLNPAVGFYLRCVAESLWYLEPIGQVYDQYIRGIWSWARSSTRKRCKRYKRYGSKCAA